MRVTAALILVVVAPIALGGCHDEDRLRKRLEGPPKRLPVEPEQLSTPPAPALLDTVRAWQQPAAYLPATTRAWSLVKIVANDQSELTYRVPVSWFIRDEFDGRATSLTKLVDAEARVTSLEDASISLASYAAQLAKGNPIFQRITVDGHVVYLTRREVALAPSDPNAARQIFHTAVVSIDGRIAKLDVRYDSTVDWRFDELATAITGTLEVRRIVNP